MRKFDYTFLKKTAHPSSREKRSAWENMCRLRSGSTPTKIITTRPCRSPRSAGTRTITAAFRSSKASCRFGRTGVNSAVIFLIFAAGFVGNGEPDFPLLDKRTNYVRHQVVYRQPAFEILRCFRRYARCQ